SVFQSILEISKPVVAVVNGPAIGGGCELAALADLIVATPKARFSQPEIKLGVFPPLAAIILPHVIGHKRALEMILTGDPLGAEEALRLGLVNRVVPEAQLEQEVEKVIAKITDQSAPVLEMAKKVLYETIGLPLADAIKRSSDTYLNQLMDLDDAREGLRAMVEKRKPVWKNK
ncbi:MAG: enoyl-CoA hydratase/isomerase family protein, partial [Acidobacteria bacterium]|nr:enoyl-CoA hydratase/isomerase family protein [Acidobacteriota bacterium]